MQYIRLFETREQYSAFTQSEDFVRPNVVMCEEDGGIPYNPLSVFMFLSSDKKLVEIPYSEGMTSDVFQQYLPSRLFYGGYVATPINSVDIEGKTMDEVDTMLGEVTRTSLAKKSNELTLGMVYKVYTFPKSVYLKSAKMVTVAGNQSMSVTALTCMPSNLFREGSIVVDDGDTPIKGVFSKTYTAVGPSGTIIYTTDILFGVEDENALLSIVDITDAVSDGERHTIRGSYKTYDNVTVITENPIREIQI